MSTTVEILDTTATVVETGAGVSYGDSNPINEVLATPVNGSPGPLVVRGLTAADLPSNVAYTNSQIIYTSLTDAPITVDPTAPGPDASAFINDCIQTLNSIGGGILYIDRGYNGNFIAYSNVILHFLPGGFFVNGTQSGKPLLRNANPIGNNGELPVDNNITIIGVPGQIVFYCGRSLNASGQGYGNDQRTSILPHNQYPAGWPTLYTQPTFGSGWMLSLVFFGVKNLTMRDVWWHDPCSFGLTLSNWENFTYENLKQTLPEDSIPSPVWITSDNRDGIHFGGRGKKCRGNGSIITSGDDSMSWAGGEYYPGPITDCICAGHITDRAMCGIRLSSKVQYGAYLDNIQILSPKLNVSTQAVLIENVYNDDAGDCRSVKVLDMSISRYGDYPYANPFYQHWIGIRHVAKDIELTGTLCDWIDPIGSNRSIVRIFEGNGTTNVRGKIAITRRDNSLTQPQALVTLEAGFSDIDYSGSGVYRDDNTPAAGNVFNITGGSHIVRGVAPRARRCGDYFNVVGNSLADLQFAGIRHELYQQGASLIKGNAGTTPVGLLSNYNGPLSANLPKLTNHNITTKRGDAFLTNGPYDGGATPNSSLYNLYNSHYGLDQAAGVDKVNSYGGPSLTDTGGQVTVNLGLYGNSIGPCSTNGHYSSTASNGLFQPAAGDFICGCWFARLGGGTFRILGVWNTPTNNCEWQWLLINNVPTFVANPDGIDSASNVIMSADLFGPTIVNKWHRLLAWIKTSDHTLNMAIDGQLQTPIAFPSAVFTGNARFAIGAVDGGDTLWCAGLIDEVTIGHGVPTLQNIADDYNSEYGRTFSF